MDVYLVRHGETLLNVRRMHQSPATPLSPRGLDQARTVAEALRPMNASFLITSDYQRAQETARVIGTALGLTPEVDPIFHEVRRPTTLYDKSHFHPLTIWYVLLSVLNRNRPGWRMQDAENFEDIRARAKRALQHLESKERKHQSVVVVSHNIFMHLLAAYMCNDGELKLRNLVPSLLHVSRMKNCGIIHLQYTKPKKGENVCPWQLVK